MVRARGRRFGIAVDVSQSNYSAGVAVGVGSQGNLQTLTCGPGAVAFFAAAGTTYYVLAIDDQEDGGGNGGSLNISFNDIPPPPTVDITMNRSAVSDIHTGVAKIPGPTRAPTVIHRPLRGRPPNRRPGFVLGFGFFSESGTCDGEPHAWAATSTRRTAVRWRQDDDVHLRSRAAHSSARKDSSSRIQLRGGAQAKAKKPKDSASRAARTRGEIGKVSGTVARRRPWRLAIPCKRRPIASA